MKELGLGGNIFIKNYGKTLSINFHLCMAEFLRR